MSRDKRGTWLGTAVLLSAFVLAGIGHLRADDWGGHQRYYNQNGYWDGQRHYHQFDNYHHHRGYWDQRNGARIFISVG